MKTTLRTVLALTVLTVFLCITACGVGRQEATPAPQAAPVATAAPTTPAATDAGPTPIPTVTTAAATVTAPEVDFAPLVAVIEQEMAQQQVPGLAVAVIDHGVPLFRRGFGVAEVATGRTVTPATPFRIGSITKPLTAIGLLQLVDAGQVDLDAPVVTYLPEFAVNDTITLRQLLSHSSGLGDAAIPYGRTDADALRDYVAGLTPDSAFAPPGALFSYSNVGFNIIGRVIEAVSGVSYADYMATHVFSALHMAHTIFDREQARAAGLALGYYPGRDGPQPVDRDPDNGAEYPSGFAFSTVEDLTQLALFLLSDGMVAGEQVLSPALVEAMRRPVIRVESLDVGYGLGVLVRHTGEATTIGHNGTINGYAATLDIMPDRDAAVIVLSNRNNYDPVRITHAAFALLGVPQETAPAAEVTLAAAALDEYTGRYVLPSALPDPPGEAVPEEAVTVAVQEGHLKAMLPGVTFAMRPVGEDRFDLYVPGEAEPVSQLAFLRDSAGAIRYMSFTLHALVRVGD